MAPSSSVSVSKLQNITIISQTVILGLSFLYLAKGDNLLHVGNFTSPVIWAILASELIKYFGIKYLFKFDDLTLITSLNRTSRDKKKTKEFKIFNVRIFEVIKILVIFGITVLFFSFLCIVLGGPFLSQHEETTSLALLLSITTILPLLLFAGPGGTIKILFYDDVAYNVNMLKEYLELLKNNVIGIIMTSWAASIVAPLDWDRDWQKYPIPNIIGALLGYQLATIFSFLQMKLKPWYLDLKKYSLF